MPPPSPDRVKGVRIFDISDIHNPKQVADVQTCRGSHTHTFVVDPKDKDNVYIYVSGSAGVRPAEELAGCSGGDPDKDPDTAVFTIVVIKVPVAHPELAKIVNSPYIFSDPRDGEINGLWKGGNHGEGTQTTSATRGCHDITAYSWLGIAGGACSGNGILLDISDVATPSASLPSPIPTTPSGTPSTSPTTARLSSSPMSGAAAASLAAAPPIPWPGAPTPSTPSPRTRS